MYFVQFLLCVGAVFASLTLIYAAARLAGAGWYRSKAEFDKNRVPVVGHAEHRS